MAVALAVSVEPELQAVRLEVTGIPAGADTLTITRKVPTGATETVRGADEADVAGLSAFIVRDYEAPFNVALSYTATVYDGAASVGTASGIATVAYTGCEAWMQDLAKPTNSLLVVIESLRELRFEIAAGVHRVLNRVAPVVTSLPAWAPSAELVVLTGELAERDQMRDLLGNGNPFLLRTTDEQGIGAQYFSPVEFVEERPLALGVAPQRRWRVAVVAVDRPDPAIFSPAAPNTYAEVAAAYSTYAALKADDLTYDEVAYQ